MSFYGAYHNTLGNKLIHIVFVPILLWTSMVWLAALPLSLLSASLAASLVSVENVLPLNGALVLAVIYLSYYLLLDVKIAVSYLPLLAFLYVSASWFALSVERSGLIAIALHIFSWYMQVHIGHMVIEGRSPALLDSFFQSLLLAPLFVWLEFLFMLGVFPTMYRTVQARVDQQIADWNNSKKKA